MSVHAFQFGRQLAKSADLYADLPHIAYQPPAGSLTGGPATPGHRGTDQGGETSQRLADQGHGRVRGKPTRGGPTEGAEVAPGYLAKTSEDVPYIASDTTSAGTDMGGPYEGGTAAPVEAPNLTPTGPGPFSQPRKIPYAVRKLLESLK